MSYPIDFAAATSMQLEAALCERLEQIRLSRNVTQAQLADEAGVSPRTIRRMAKGEGVSLDTFLRVLTALGLQGNLEALLPDPSVSPIDRVRSPRKQRRRARPRATERPAAPWTWGDSEETDD
jgi:transcriptional regulator with XRE-family HTH domain